MGEREQVTPAITIGSYAMPDFVRLNILQCRMIWPDSFILISDDRSESSPMIERIADDLDCSYRCSENRRTHVSGDFQAFINGAVFAKTLKQSALKLSQRFIPRRVEFATRMAHEMVGKTAILPGAMRREQIARPQASFYLRFGHLTDCVLWDPNIITPEVLLQEYKAGGIGHPSNLFSELAWDRIRKSHPNVVRCHWLANQESFSDKLYLRKASSNPAEYEALARSHGIGGNFSCIEWRCLEESKYRSVPATV